MAGTCEVENRHATLQKEIISAAKAQGSWEYFLNQRKKTPVSNFIKLHPLLSDLAKANFIRKPEQNSFKYEVVSKELRAFIKSLNAAIIENTADGYNHLVADTIELYATKIMDVSEDAETYAIEDNKKLQALKKLREVLLAYIEKKRNRAVQSGTKRPVIKGAITRACNSVKSNYESNLQRRIVHSTANKNMLMAFLKSDYKSFKKAFVDFKKTMSDIYPEKYAEAIGEASELYDKLCESPDIKLQQKDKELLLYGRCGDEFNFAYYLSASFEVAQMYLNKENNIDQKRHYINDFEDESNSLADDSDRDKLDIFVEKAIAISKFDLEREIIKQMADLKILRDKHNKEIISKKGLFSFWYKFISRFCELSGASSYTYWEGGHGSNHSQYQQAKAKLESSLQHVKHLKSFYYSYDLQSVLKIRFRGKESTNIYKAIQYKVASGSLWQSVKRTIVNKLRRAWGGVKSFARSLSGKIRDAWFGIKNSIAEMWRHDLDDVDSANDSIASSSFSHVGGGTMPCAKESEQNVWLTSPEKAPIGRGGGNGS